MISVEIFHVLYLVASCLLIICNRSSEYFVFSFYPTALKGCRGIVFTHGVRMGGRREIVCPGSISATIRCRKLILGRDIS